MIRTFGFLLEILHNFPFLPRGIGFLMLFFFRCEIEIQTSISNSFTSCPVVIFRYITAIFSSAIPSNSPFWHFIHVACRSEMQFLKKTYSSPKFECYSSQTCLELINDLKKAVCSYVNLRVGFGLG